ncbi:hypothetical protein [Marisediminicola sp. LYQ134]|uniref:hypothetical protein n=1 Tax=unclassified Marisediminicola TaxID=2618316 RepID=UPI003983344A
MNSSTVFRRILTYTLIIAAAILVVGGGVGYLVAGMPGLISAGIGVGITVALSAITIGSIAIASNGSVNMFFATVLGAWIVKAIVFIAILALLRDQPFVNGPVLFFSIVAAVTGTLAVDVIVVLKSRMPYVDQSAGSGDPAGR